MSAPPERHTSHAHPGLGFAVCAARVCHTPPGCEQDGEARGAQRKGLGGRVGLGQEGMGGSVGLGTGGDESERRLSVGEVSEPKLRSSIYKPDSWIGYGLFLGHGSTNRGGPYKSPSSENGVLF